MSAAGAAALAAVSVRQWRTNTAAPRRRVCNGFVIGVWTPLKRHVMGVAQGFRFSPPCLGEDT